MNKKIATATLGFLTVGSLSLTIASEVEAFATRSSNTNIITTTSPTDPTVEVDVSQSEANQSIAYYGVDCETYTDGYNVVTCCIDSYGYWVCTW